MKPEDIATREADILGKPQRIEPLAEEAFGPEASALVVELRATLGLETIAMPEWFRVMLHHPRLFKCQAEMGILFFQGEIPPRERELAVLRVAWCCKAPYEWGEHVRIAKRCGVTDEEILGVIAGSNDPAWGELDRALLRGVEELLDRHMISDEIWTLLARHWSEAQLVEFPALVGAYVTVALQQNALRIRLADDNPGLTGR